MYSIINNSAFQPINNKTIYNLLNKYIGSSLSTNLQNGIENFSHNNVNSLNGINKSQYNGIHNVTVSSKSDQFQGIPKIDINSIKKKELIENTKTAAANAFIDKQLNIKLEKHKRPGIVFDIDGVLVKGKKIIPETVRTLQLLDTLKIPYIFLTNGGGVPEKQKALELSKRFNVTINEEQVVLGHSPMKWIAEKYKNDIVLIIGPDSCKDVAYSYGFNKPLLTKEIVSWRPSIWPFEGQPKLDCPYDLDNEPIRAVLMFNDSPTWGRDIQISCDVLRSIDGKLGTVQTPFVHQAVPCYFAAADILWSNDFPLSRFGQGAFKLAFESLFQELTGQKLEFVQYGKPEKSTYDYSKNMLEKISKKFFNKQISNVYAVGDNPSVDIKGANSYGWHSILVRTGVFKQGENDKQNPANTVVNNVLDSVLYILSKENIITK